jgi:hypothetical protein
VLDERKQEISITLDERLRGMIHKQQLHSYVGLSPYIHTLNVICSLGSKVSNILEYKKMA